MPSPTQTPPDAGQRMIGNYRLERRVGGGAMGTVYEAVHVHIGKRAAIKVLRRELSDNPELAARFVNEARALVLVRHPGVVEVFDFGLLADGTAYMIMEFLDAPTLLERMREAGAPLGQEALSIARQVARALHTAHEQQIIHRDLKPGNISVFPDGHVTIFDFGIAKVRLPQSDSGVETSHNALLGTPRYMSPEQCRGAANVDGKTDVYSLGVILFEMLSGQPPFTAKMPGELLFAHMATPPPRLTAVPQEIDGFVQRLLAKDPGARPSMAEVAETIEAWESTGLGQALGGSPRDETGDRAVAFSIPPTLGMTRRRGALALLGLLLLAGGASLGWRWLRDPVTTQTRPPDLGPVSHPARAPDQVPAMTRITEKPAPDRVSWVVSTDPEGAQVLEGARVLGLTPLRVERALRAGETVELTLRLKGYFDKGLVLDAAAPGRRLVELLRVKDENIEIFAPPRKRRTTRSD